MSLFSRMLQAVHSWRRPRSGRKTAKRAAVQFDQLEHRKLLAVNFTGNVAIDFPATMQPGVVVLPNNPSVIHPVISPGLQPLVKVSGFDVNGIRVSYSASDDTLSFGIEQPLSQQPTHPGPVVAGDADNNGDSGTVNPSVSIAQPGFQDFADMAGSEQLGVFLDLNGNGAGPNLIAAGFDQFDTRLPKPYQVAQAVLDTSQPVPEVVFGTQLPQHEGNVYLVNSPAHPNLEFSITHFSELYQSQTGKPLTANSVFYVGGYGGSADDFGIGEAFFPAQPVKLADATVPPPELCAPSISINPHEHRIIDTRHRDLVRVYVFGTSGFKVSEIDPNSVSLNGAKAIARVNRRVNRDEFPDATFIFRADEMNLPYGKTRATISGMTYGGMRFESSSSVLNVPNSAALRGELARLGGSKSIPGARAILARSIAESGAPRVSVNYNPAIQSQPQTRSNAQLGRNRRGASTFLGQRQAKSAAARPLSARLHHSVNAFAARLASAR